MSDTPTDDSKSVESRIYPDIMVQVKIALSGADTEESAQFNDVKSATIVCDQPIEFNLSLGSSPGDLTTTGTDGRVLHHPGGGASMFVGQYREFNKVYAKITAGTGTATVRIYPGKGQTA